MGLRSFALITMQSKTSKFRKPYLGVFRSNLLCAGEVGVLVMWWPCVCKFAFISSSSSKFQVQAKKKIPLWHLPKTWPKKETSILNQNRKHKNYFLISTPTKGQPWKNNYPLPPEFPSGLVSRPKPNSLSRSHTNAGCWGEGNPGLRIALRTAAGFTGVRDARGWTDEFTQTQNEPKSQQPARVEQDNPSKNPKARILNSHSGQLTPVGT